MPLNLGQVQPHVQAAAEEIESIFGNLTIGGWRATGSVADSDHPKGLAIDVMTPSSAIGNKVAEYGIENASRLNISYIIWNRRIWQNGTWKPYSGPSAHTDHVHLSFNSSGTQNFTNPLSANSGCLGKLLGSRTTDTRMSTLFLVFAFRMFKWGVPVYTMIAIGG
jgi:hypothetical protein